MAFMACLRVEEGHLLVIGTVFILGRSYFVGMYRTWVPYLYWAHIILLGCVGTIGRFRLDFAIFEFLKMNGFSSFVIFYHTSFVWGGLPTATY